MRATMRRQNIIEIIIILVVFIAISLLSSAFQQRLSYNEGKGWDGANYFSGYSSRNQIQIASGFPRECSH